MLALIDRWRAGRARAQALGRRWEPLPPGVAPREPPPPPRRRRPERARVLGGLRALFRTQ
jgi:hypothetical protein